MAAPSTTARGTPDGIPLEDGFPTKIANKTDATIEFWERTVKPVGYDGGDLIDISTMHNTLYKTKVPRTLIDVTESVINALYDPELYTTILNILNLNDEWTLHFPDGSTVDFWGALRVFDPQENAEGEPPNANITIEPTNWDGSAEQGPVVTEVAGT